MNKLNCDARNGDRCQHIRVNNQSAGSSSLANRIAGSPAKASLIKTVDSARMCFEKQTDLLTLSMKKNVLNKTMLALATGLALSGFAIDSEALGVGSATVDSYIGESLLVRVPLFNVENPNSLSVTLTEADGTVSKLRAEISRADSQFGIVVRSEGRVNEPYLNFTLDLNDNSNMFSKEFTVLLNLSPQASNSGDASNSGAGDVTSFSAQPLDNNTSSNVNDSSQNLYNKTLMGPYEWAEAGRIPERFGAVLDGQSLWRVARRINQGLGVSINQMMWALYQQNPDAFSSKSINSLKAGSFLTIPSFQTTSQFSDSEAKRQLDSTLTDSELTNSLVSTSTVEESAGQAPEQITRGVEGESSEAVQQFQLTAIDETASGSGVGTSASDGKSQEIISSLAETVGNLTQELIRKDKQIAFLEEKVEALAEFAGVDADLSVESAEASIIADGLELSEDSISDTIDLVEDELTELDLAEAELSELDEFEIEAAELDETDGESIELDLTDSDVLLSDDIEIDSELLETNIENSESVALDSQQVEKVETDAVASFQQSVKSFLGKLADWHWIAIALGGLALLGLLFRRRIAGAFGSLNLFRQDDAIEFKQSVFDDTDAPIGNTNQAPSGPNIRSTTTSNSGPKDFSVMSSVKREGEDKEAIEGVSYLAVDENGEYQETDEDEFSEGDLEFVNDEDMTFSERFERLIEDKDFDFARELLDFARYNEIDEERYHCERLRLLQAMKDEDGFYEYYYEIESKIPSFAPDHQTQISQLVVELAQHEG